MNRPDKLNAFANQMRQEIAAAVGQLGERNDVRVIVITGAGKGFSAGADVSYTKQLADHRDEEALRALVRAGRDVVIAIRRAPQPVIASVNGPAAGAGASLALACDIRIASERASFGLTFNRVGLHPDWGGTYFLPRLVGTAAAAELIYSGSMIKSAPSATSPMSVVVDIAAIAASRVSGSTFPISTPLEEMLEFEEEAQVRCALSDDGAEGLTAFLEKREPNFGALK
jgi:2-(1,2-epoxy-1,2-dihydrophenyl)acetyl-CoA isomerase